MIQLGGTGSDLVAGHLCLEFVNTVRWRARARPEETLHSYDDLVRWARGVGLVSRRRAQTLLRQAHTQPAECGRVLRQAIDLRESICRIFLSLIHNRTPTESDLAVLNTTLRRTSRGGRVIRNGRRFAWDWGVDQDALDSLAGAMALSAAGLMTSLASQRVGQCADDRGCGWLFLDTSRNHSRRWCDINDCGNRAKQRRHNARKRSLRHTSPTKALAAQGIRLGRVDE